MEEKYLTVAEVAERLRISKATVLRMVNSREITADRAGVRQWRIPESALAEYITRNRSEAKAEK